MTSKKQPFNQLYHNNRIAYIIAIVFTILLGLASRKWSHLLPSFLAQNAGDVLWAMMVYFGFRFLLARKSLLVAILLGLSFSFFIEFTQLYQAGWINQIRSTTIGALILGKGFLAVDLIRYLVGTLLATFLDKVTLLLIKQRETRDPP